MNILDFSVFVFDLDGVVINSEFIHFECYKQAFNEIIDYNLDWNDFIIIPNNRMFFYNNII